MSADPRQLPLPLEPRPRYDAAEFFQTAGSRLAREMLEKPQLWSNGRLIIWGEAGAGKTHLLHIWAACHAAMFVSGAALDERSCSVSTPVVIDDSDSPFSEISLLHLLNTAAEARQPVLLAARRPPSRQQVGLADLSSRLRASTIVEISPPTDEELAALLGRLAAQRQLVLTPQVQAYLLSHLSRTPRALVEAVTRLDQAALANGGRITRQLAASLMNDIAADGQTGPQMLSNGHSQATTEML